MSSCSSPVASPALCAVTSDQCDGYQCSPGFDGSVVCVVCCVLSVCVSSLSLFSLLLASVWRVLCCAVLCCCVLLYVVVLCVCVVVCVSVCVGRGGGEEDLVYVQNALRVYIQTVPVCTGERPTCFIHVDVVPVHTETFLNVHTGGVLNVHKGVFSVPHHTHPHTQQQPHNNNTPHQHTPTRHRQHTHTQTDRDLKSVLSKSMNVRGPERRRTCLDKGTVSWRLVFVIFGFWAVACFPHDS